MTVDLYTTPREFYFDAPLYKTYEHASPEEGLKQMFNPKLHESGDIVDGYCIRCGKESPFTQLGYDFGKPDPIQMATNVAYKHPLLDIAQRRSFDVFRIQCTRCRSNIVFLIAVNASKVTKVGQYPSLADISSHELKSLRKHLPKDWARELQRAIGLASNGVGIGSFVYLRRVFENIVLETYEAHASTLKISEQDFRKLRLRDKVKKLDGFLPSFLVENPSIYSILSKGVHELSEEECLSSFDVLKASIFFILEERATEMEKLKRMDEVRKAISALAK